MNLPQSSICSCIITLLVIVREVLTPTPAIPNCWWIASVYPIVTDIRHKIRFKLICFVILENELGFNMLKSCLNIIQWKMCYSSTFFNKLLKIRIIFLPCFKVLLVNFGFQCFRKMEETTLYYNSKHIIHRPYNIQLEIADNRGNITRNTKF